MWTCRPKRKGCRSPFRQRPSTARSEILFCSESAAAAAFLQAPSASFDLFAVVEGPSQGAPPFRGAVLALWQPQSTWQEVLIQRGCAPRPRSLVTVRCASSRRKRPRVAAKRVSLNYHDLSDICRRFFVWSEYNCRGFLEAADVTTRPSWLSCCSRPAGADSS